MNKRNLACIILAVVSTLCSQQLRAERISDIRNTRHNLSVDGPGSVTATTENQVCVFCHTPHQAEAIPAAPLWNRELSGATYTPYTSESIDANDIAATPGGSSKLCLSCHDGTIAVGNVNVLNNQANVSIAMNGTGTGGVMPDGGGATTGFTRKLGSNLTNDHPISFTYDDPLASADGELRLPSASAHIATRTPGTKPSVPLENGQMQCTSCHDPHIRDSDISQNIKFLRLNRFQLAAPGGGAFNEAIDIICLGCHDKQGLAWSESAHADPTVANEVYNSAAAALREFPANTPVWKASCLNCHDTHTVQGSRRLLREATDSLSTPKSGGNAALEEACYTCHSSATDSILTDVTEVPNIKSDFSLARHMPIKTSEQALTTSETHAVLNADLFESKSKLNNANRHVECSDCHNPHRVMKNQLFNGTGSNVAGTHRHTEPHDNIASGVLRGAWGVEPVYGTANFNPTNLPTTYDEKGGDGGLGASTSVASNHVTREYQICFKCHSDYAYGTTPPMLGDTGGNTPSGTNGLTQYTNQAIEFQAPLGHRGSPASTTDSGADSTKSSNNHRSWHPVMDSTGRDTTARGGNNLTFNAPFSGSTYLGSQTMGCSDCHGSATASGSVVPTGGEDGNPWGPHGSSNNFLLKGGWSSSSRDLCLKCHNPTSGGSGFADGGDNLHSLHNSKIDGSLKCNWCHVAVPHGFKNKALLANLRDVGPEVGEVAGTSVSAPYNKGPYYMNAMVRINSFAASGSWTDSDCGGREWMRSACDSPP